MHYFLILLLLIVNLIPLNIRANDKSDEKLIAQLRTLVELNSGSKNSNGVRKIQEWILTQLKTMGFEVKLDEKNFLLATLPGSNSKTITFIVHADTVFEPNSGFEGFKMSEDQKTGYGPGVIDDKGGIVIALEGIKKFLSSGSSNFNLQFISSPTEEIGSSDFINEFRERAKNSWLVLGFEPSLEEGSIISSRRGDRWYQIEVKGKESHAGRAHKEGVNACVELSHKLVDISKLTDYKKNVTVSVGRIEGGQDKFNIVCGEAHAKIDTRFSSLKDRDQLHSKIIKILNSNIIPGSSTHFSLADDCPPFIENKLVKSLIQKYLDIAKQTEDKFVKAEFSGGAADSNYFSHDNSMILDGLGAVGGKMHSKEEFIIISSLKSRSEVLATFLRQL